MSKISFLDLGKQPIANGFLTEDQFEDEFFYHLSVGFDEETCLITQMDCVRPELMFNDTYAYRGSMSETMVNHFSEFSELMKSKLPHPYPRLLEIGSNDGVFLKNWKPGTITAVEPCGNFAKETNRATYFEL